MKQQIEYYQAVQQQFMNANTGSGDFYRGTCVPDRLSKVNPA